MSILISQSIPPTSPSVSIHLFFMSVSLFLLCKYVHLYHFSRFHIYALIYEFVFLFLTYFIPYDMTDSVSIHISTNEQFCSGLWLSSIPLYICTTSSLPINLSLNIKLFLCPGYCKLCCNE